MEEINNLYQLENDGTAKYIRLPVEKPAINALSVLDNQLIVALGNQLYRYVPTVLTRALAKQNSDLPAGQKITANLEPIKQQASAIVSGKNNIVATIEYRKIRNNYCNITTIN